MQASGKDLSIASENMKIINEEVGEAQLGEAELITFKDQSQIEAC